jgi:hypothetical protein
MQLSDAKIGDYLNHGTDTTFSGRVVGVDPVGPMRPTGSCIYLATERDQWLRVGTKEIADYQPRGT